MAQPMTRSKYYNEARNRYLEWHKLYSSAVRVAPTFPPGGPGSGPGNDWFFRGDREIFSHIFFPISVKDAVAQLTPPQNESWAQKL